MSRRLTAPSPPGPCHHGCMSGSPGTLVCFHAHPDDEVITTGMDFTEAEWTERTEIDLARFANRTATLTVELSANSNVCLEVSVKAWLRDLRIADASK